MAFISGRTSFIFGIEEITVYCYSDMRFIHFAVFLFCLVREFPMLQKSAVVLFFFEDSKIFCKYKLSDSVMSSKRT